MFRKQTILILERAFENSIGGQFLPLDSKSLPLTGNLFTEAGLLHILTLNKTRDPQYTADMDDLLKLF